MSKLDKLYGFLIFILGFALSIYWTMWIIMSQVFNSYYFLTHSLANLFKEFNCLEIFPGSILDDQDAAPCHTHWGILGCNLYGVL